MAFDLASAKPSAPSGKFDLSSAKPVGAEAAAPQKLSRLDVDPRAGLGETLMTGISGMAGSVAGGIGGLGKLVTSGDPEAASDTVRRIQSATTYQPRTAIGRKTVEGFGKAGELMHRPVAWAAEKATEGLTDAGAPPQLAGGVGAAIDIAPTVAATLYGAKLGQGKGAAVAMDDTLAASDAARTAAARAESAITGAGMDWENLGRGVKQRIIALAQDSKTLDALGPNGLARVAKAESLPSPVKLTRAVAQRSDAGMRAEDVLSRTEEGAPIAQRLADKNSELSQNLDILKGRTGGTAPTAEAAGKSIVDTLEAARRRDLGRADALYKKAEANGEATQLIPAKPLLDYFNEHPEPDLIGYIQTKLKRYVKQDAEGDLVLRDPLQDIPISQLEIVRRDANRVGKNKISPKAHYAGEVRDVIDSMIPDAAGGAQYKAARAAWKRMKETYDDPKTIDRLIETDPRAVRATAIENVVKDTAISAKTSAAELNRVRNTLLTKGGLSGRRAWRDIKGSVVDYIKEQASKGIAGEDSASMAAGQTLNRGFQMAGYKRALATIGDGKLELMFGKDGLKLLKDVGEVSEYWTIPAARSGASTAANAAATMSKLGNVLEKLKHAPLVGSTVRGAAGLVQKVAASGARSAAAESALLPTQPAAGPPVRSSYTFRGALGGAATGQEINR